MAIRYVCLSDLHFGAETSLLTELDGAGRPEYARLSPVGEALIDCLADLLKPAEAAVGADPVKAQLVLAGDILELALAQTHEALMSFTVFMRALIARDLFAKEIILLPGNHDHHIWETGREQFYYEYVDKLWQSSKSTPPTDFEPMWSVTRLFMAEHEPEQGAGKIHVAAPRSYLLESAVGKDKVQFTLAYPNWGLGLSGDHAVVITHGHFTEPIYSLLSQVSAAIFREDPEPSELSIEELEQENFAWIDFFWSVLGRSGDVGNRVQQIYELAADESKREVLAKRLAHAAVHQWNVTWLHDRIEEWLVTKLIERLAKKMIERERRSSDASGRDEVLAYVNGPLRRQIAHERKDQVPRELTLIFGHTHKPFVDRLEHAKDWNLSLFNTGGWVVDSVEPNLTHGASMLLIDDAHSCAALSLFTEPALDARPGPVHVAIAGASPRRNPLETELTKRKFDTDPWTRFTRVVGEGVAHRRMALHRRLHTQDD